MAKWLQNVFKMANPQKYIGSNTPFYRSSWELAFMNMCDTNPGVVSWASEPMRIPYQNPFTKQFTVYIPDFLVEYVDSKGQRHVEMVEIKPASQTHIKEAKSKKDKIALAINAHKWQAAAAYCAKKGIRFRILTEDDLFAARKPRRK